MAQAELSLPDEFSSTMQQLVAEAEKTVPYASEEREMRGDLVALNARMARLEQMMATGFEKVAAAAKGGNQPWQLERIDENLRALRNTESVNQRLFNSLHEELRSYRDNFLRDSLQKPVIRDLVVLLDDLSLLADGLHGATSKSGSKLQQWRGNLENTMHMLVEILHRLEVNEIESKPRVDRALHRVASCEAAENEAEDGLIVKRLKRGFMWRDQVLRPEEVVAKRFV